MNIKYEQQKIDKFSEKLSDIVANLDCSRIETICLYIKDTKNYTSVKNDVERFSSSLTAKLNAFGILYETMQYMGPEGEKLKEKLSDYNDNITNSANEILKCIICLEKILSDKDKNKEIIINQLNNIFLKNKNTLPSKAQIIYDLSILVVKKLEANVKDKISA